MPVDATIREAAHGSDHSAQGELYPCPVCGGGLIPLRGTWRCGRCSFVLCVGCDPGLYCPAPHADEE